MTLPICSCRRPPIISAVRFPPEEERRGRSLPFRLDTRSPLSIWRTFKTLGRREGMCKTFLEREDWDWDRRHRSRCRRRLVPMLRKRLSWTVPSHRWTVRIRFPVYACRRLLPLTRPCRPTRVLPHPFCHYRPCRKLPGSIHSVYRRLFTTQLGSPIGIKYWNCVALILKRLGTPDGMDGPPYTMPAIVDVHSHMSWKLSLPHILVPFSNKTRTNGVGCPSITHVVSRPQPKSYDCCYTSIRNGALKRWPNAIGWDVRPSFTPSGTTHHREWSDCCWKWIHLLSLKKIKMPIHHWR